MRLKPDRTSRENSGVSPEADNEVDPHMRTPCPFHSSLDLGVVCRSVGKGEVGVLPSDLI